MKITVYFDKEEETFLTETEINERKAELAQEMADYPSDCHEVRNVIGNMDIEDLWDAFTPEAKKSIIDKAVETWFSDTDFYVQGDIEV